MSEQESKKRNATREILILSQRVIKIEIDEQDRLIEYSNRQERNARLYESERLISRIEYYEQARDDLKIELSKRDYEVLTPRCVCKNCKRRFAISSYLNTISMRLRAINNELIARRESE